MKLTIEDLVIEGTPDECYEFKLKLDKEKNLKQNRLTKEIYKKIISPTIKIEPDQIDVFRYTPFYTYEAISPNTFRCKDDGKIRLYNEGVIVKSFECGFIES